MDWSNILLHPAAITLFVIAAIIAILSAIPKAKPISLKGTGTTGSTSSSGALRRVTTGVTSRLSNLKTPLVFLVVIGAFYTLIVWLLKYFPLVGKLLKDNFMPWGFVAGCLLLAIGVAIFLKANKKKYKEAFSQFVVTAILTALIMTGLNFLFAKTNVFGNAHERPCAVFVPNGTYHMIKATLVGVNEYQIDLPLYGGPRQVDMTLAKNQRFMVRSVQAIGIKLPSATNRDGKIVDFKIGQYGAYSGVGSDGRPVYVMPSELRYTNDLVNKCTFFCAPLVVINNAAKLAQEDVARITDSLQNLYFLPNLYEGMVVPGVYRIRFRVDTPPSTT